MLQLVLSQENALVYTAHVSANNGSLRLPVLTARSLPALQLFVYLVNQEQRSEYRL